MCKIIAAELSNATSLPTSCRSMLSKIAKDSLTVYAEERHPYQLQAVMMAAEAMAGVQAKLEDDIVEAQAAVDSADKEKTSRLDRVRATDPTELEGAVNRANEAVAAEIAAEKAAKATLSGATTAVAVKDAQFTATQDMKSRLALCVDHVSNWKIASVESKRSLIAAAKCLADAGLENGLVDSLEATFKHDVNTRGTYDNLVIKEVDDFMNRRLVELEVSIKDWDTGKTDLATKKETAERALAASAEQICASHIALAEARAHMKEGKTNHAAAIGALARYEGDIAKASKNLIKANAALTSFVEGPKKHFEMLKSLAPPPSNLDDSAVGNSISTETSQGDGTGGNKA